MRHARKTGLAILVIGITAVVAGRQARAQDGPPVLLGITIDSSTLMPTPDPQWQIDFKLSLAPGSTLTSGSYLNISNIAHADGTTLVSSPYSSWVIDQQAGTTNFTFIYKDAANGTTPPVMATDAPIPLGDFYVELDVPYFPDQVPDTIVTTSRTPLFYTSAATDNVTRDIDTGRGTTTPSIGTVPEPASLFQLATGLGVAIYWARRRVNRPIG